MLSCANFDLTTPSLDVTIEEYEFSLKLVPSVCRTDSRMFHTMDASEPGPLECGERVYLSRFFAETQHPQVPSVDAWMVARKSPDDSD